MPKLVVVLVFRSMYISVFGTSSARVLQKKLIFVSYELYTVSSIFNFFLELHFVGQSLMAEVYSVFCLCI